MFLFKFDVLPAAFIWKDWEKYDEKPLDSQNEPNFEQEIAWTRSRSASRDIHYQCRTFGYHRRLQYELLLPQERTEFPHLLNRAIKLVALWKGKRLSCLILRAVVAGALEELNKFGTYYTASSPIERRILLFLQETFLL